jgi:hypothetical protein
MRIAPATEPGQRDGRSQRAVAGLQITGQPALPYTWQALGARN